MSTDRAGMSPGEAAAKANDWRRLRAQQAEEAAKLDRALAHVLGSDAATRNDDQRLVWTWLTREVYSVCQDLATLPVFEGRRQKGAEAIVAIERDMTRRQEGR